MKEEIIWKIYNFVNSWKAGHFGIRELGICAEENLNLIVDNETLDSLVEKYIAENPGKEEDALEKAFRDGFKAAISKTVEQLLEGS